MWHRHSCLCGPSVTANPIFSQLLRERTALHRSADAERRCAASLIAALLLKSLFQRFS